MIRATDVFRGRIVPDAVLRVSEDAIPKRRASYLKIGDIIIVRSGAYTGDIGYYEGLPERAIAGYDLVVSPSDALNSRYLLHWLLSHFVQQQYFGSLKDRAAQSHLNSTQVAETPVPLPPRSEQDEIAQRLDGVCEAAGRNERMVDDLRTLKRGLMQQLLTGKVRVQV